MKPKQNETMKTFTATIEAPSHAMAKQIASAWSHKTMRGHDISSARPDGSTSVTLYNVSESEKGWIDSLIDGMNSKMSG